MDNQTINHYVDLIAQDAIGRDVEHHANYKTHAYQRATKSVSLFDLCQRIDVLLSSELIKQVALKFGEDYQGDPEINVAVYHEEGHETFYDNPEFVYYLKTTDEQRKVIERSCDYLLRKLQSVEDEYGFFWQVLGTKKFNKTDTAVALFAKLLPDAFAMINAAIEHELITKSISASSSHSLKKKI